MPKTMRQHGSILVVVDKLTNVSHFIPMKSTHKETHIAKIYMKKHSRLHDFPKEITSDKDPKFTSKFWIGLFKEFGTNLNFSKKYHPNSDGQKNRVNKVIEDM